MDFSTLTAVSAQYIDNIINNYLFHKLVIIPLILQCIFFKYDIVVVVFFIFVSLSYGIFLSNLFLEGILQYTDN